MSEISDIKPNNSAFRWYMSGQFIWFAGMGIQFVAFQAVGALTLNLTASELGLAQACILLPALVFMLPAGVAAERNDVRLLLMKIQLAAALPPLALALMVINGSIDFPGLIIFALLSGTLGAFAMPVRDMLISYLVVPSQIQRAVNVATGLQFAGNMIGMALVGFAEIISIGYIIMLHSVCLLFAAWCSYKLPSDIAPAPVFLDDNLITKRRTQIIEGVRFAMSDKKIAPVLIMMLAMSVFYMGTYFVFFPLLVRDYYNGGSADMAIINGLFWAGMMVASFTLTRLGLVQALGKLMVGAAITGLIVLFLLSIPGPYLWLWSLCFIWGCGGGIFMASSRTIIQLQAPDSYRGRILSIYQLSFMGGAPIGALLFGLLADYAPNLHHTPFVPLIGMTIVLAFACFFSALLSIELNENGEIK